MYGGAALATAEGFALVAAVGAMATGVGMLTENKDLIKIGSVMGLVGGVGALATSAGELGAEAGSGTLSGMDNAAVANADYSNVGGAAASGASETAQQALPASAVPDVAPQSPAAEATASASTNAQSATPAATQAAPAAGATASVSPPVETPGGVLNSAAATAPMPPAPPVEDGLTVTDRMQQFFNPIGTFIQGNQNFSSAALLVSGSFLQGLFKKPTPAEEAAANANNAQADLMRQRMTNMAAPLPTATSTPRPITPLPTFGRPGLLNVPPPNVPAVTGVPAP